jgi:hypothetical protein
MCTFFLNFFCYLLKWRNSSKFHRSTRVKSETTLTRLPSTLALERPQLVSLVPEPVLEQSLAAWSSVMRVIQASSNSSSPMPFWASPCPKLWVSSVLWWPSCCCLHSRPHHPPVVIHLHIYTFGFSATPHSFIFGHRI